MTAASPALAALREHVRAFAHMMLRLGGDGLEQWMNQVEADDLPELHSFVRGLCYSATLDEIRRHDHVLTPGRYVGAPEVQNEDDEPIADRIARLTKELYACFEESARLEKVVREQLEKINV